MSHTSCCRASGKTKRKLWQCFAVRLSIDFMESLLQIISGVRLTDTALKRTYDFDDLAQVFVMQKS